MENTRNVYRTFLRGGIHPNDYKYFTNDEPLRNALIPSVSLIPMSQHMGKPAECIVNIGDTVKECMLIGKSAGFFSSQVHSPVPGKVADIIEIYLPNGIKSKAVKIELEGEFSRSGKSMQEKDWSSLKLDEFLSLINEMGIVGLGGATFPAYIKYSIKDKSKLEYLVINGVECEPFLTSDHRLMIEKPEKILEGIKILKKMLTPKKIIIGIEANKQNAIDILTETAKSMSLDVEVAGLKVQYPQGDEKKLLKALIDREVPSGGLPLDIGAVVSNVGTVFAIYEAVVYGKPLIERCVTVTGSVIKKPANLKARIGTPIKELIEECGGFTEIPGKVIVGGPMMGFTLADLDSPVTKGVSGVIAFSKKEVKLKKRTNCIECGKCISACPFGLSPTLLYKLIDHQFYNESLENGLLDCKECGCCSYVCPARIPLVQGFKLGKLISRKMKS